MRRRSRFARFAACGALAHARFAALRRSRSRSVRRVAVAALSLRSARRVAVAALSLRSALRVAVAALPLALGSPLGAALSLTLGSPLWAAALSLALGFPLWAAVSGGGKGSLCDLLRRRSRSRPVRRVAALSLTLGRILPHKHIFKHNYKPKPQAQRSSGFPHSKKKYAPSGGVFPLSDIYFCFAYSAIALYFSKSSGRRMRALAGLVEGSSMHGMQPQGSQNRL